MKLTKLKASRYRSLNDVNFSLEQLNVLIGANASGKSNILDALRFLADGAREGDFENGVAERGGILHLAWKGEDAEEITLETRYEDEGNQYAWLVGLKRVGHGFEVWERVDEFHEGKPPSRLLEAKGGKAWWWSAQAKDDQGVRMALAPTACALSSASADESFPARKVAKFVRRWGFFDPSPPLLRRASYREDATRLDPSGRNLSARLLAIQEASDGAKIRDRIITATRRVLGVPESIEIRPSDIDGRVYFVQSEPNLTYRVHQVGASSGTLRMLALMTALFGESDTSLVGIEEPENHVHPSALKAFAEYLRDASSRIQLVITTHSPLLLDCLPTPQEVAIVRRTPQGTAIEKEEHPEAIEEALEASGFGLGEFYETKGFGA